MCSRTVDDESLKEGQRNNTTWIDNWAIGDIGFHQPKYDVVFDNFGDKMFEGKKKSIFVPLCGKSPDLIWMYNQGHTVCGAELAEQAIKELFEENNIEVEVEEIKNVGKLYKSKDKRLNIYVADMFDLSVETCGQFDIVYDSRSLVAINTEDHKVYTDFLLSLMKKDGQYYLSTIEYEETVWPGPPHSTSDKLVKSLYGDRLSIEMLEEKNRTNQDINAGNKKKEESSEPPAKKPSSAGAAIKTSSYVYDRWYLMLFK